MWTLIIKNNGGSPITIEDLGITVPASSQITFSDQFEYQEIASSDDLRDEVNSGNLVVNDGSSDLSSANGVLYLTLYNAKETADEFYTQTALQTSGQSSVHWDNITNAPSFGAVSWKEPVEARARTIAASPPGTPAVGDFYIDSGDNHLYKYSGTWDDQGAPTSGDRAIVLDSTAQMIYEWSGSSWDAQTDNEDGDAVMVNDDGDGKQAQYVYDFGTLAWVKIADIDYGEPNDLDGAYDQGGAGAGRSITADSGAVKIDTASATNAPIELTQKSSLPTTGLAAGQLAVKDGILFIYDGTRSKWLSVERLYLVFGRRGNTSNQYLSYSAGRLPSNNSGLRIPRDACVVAMSAQLDASGTANMRLRRNDSASNISTLAISAALGAHDTSLDINLSAGDFLQMYSDNASSVQDPMVIVEIAYRA